VKKGNIGVNGKRKEITEKGRGKQNKDGIKRNRVR